MTAPTHNIELGDYVRVAPTSDVWIVKRLDGPRAVLSPSSIVLAGRPRRTAQVDELTLVRATPVDDAF